MLMIELNINDGSYDRVADSTDIQTAVEEADSASNDIATDGADQTRQNIFTLARGIADRGYRYRPLRRSSSIL